MWIKKFCLIYWLLYMKSIIFRSELNIYQMLLMTLPFWIFWVVTIAFIILLILEFVLLFSASKDFIEKLLWVVAILLFPPLVIAYIFIYRDRNDTD